MNANRMYRVYLPNGKKSKPVTREAIIQMHSDGKIPNGAFVQQEDTTLQVPLNAFVTPNAEPGAAQKQSQKRPQTVSDPDETFPQFTPTSKFKPNTQPTHSHEIIEDRQRWGHAISAAPDKFKLIAGYLMQHEKPVCMAVQRQFPFSLFADVVLLTSHRLLCFKRWFTKITLFDVNYVELGDVTVQQGYFTASLHIRAVSGYRSTVMNGLITSQALEIYRQCQDIETKARIARRQHQLEENRSKTNQMNINTGTPHPMNPGLNYNGQPDLRRIGREESDPYTLDQ